MPTPTPNQNDGGSGDSVLKVADLGRSGGQAGDPFTFSLRLVGDATGGTIGDSNYFTLNLFDFAAKKSGIEEDKK